MQLSIRRESTSIKVSQDENEMQIENFFPI